MISTSSASRQGERGDHNSSTSTSFEQRSSTSVVGGDVRPRMREILRRGGGSAIAGATGAALVKGPVGRNMIRNWRSWRRRFSGFEGAADEAIVGESGIGFAGGVSC